MRGCLPGARQLAEKIIRRYPSVSADFLLLGKSGGHLDRELSLALAHPRAGQISSYCAQSAQL
jgi:hypothetical protein